MKQVIYTGHK